MAQRVLITGVNGFVGRYLAAAVQKAGGQVFGTGLDPHSAWSRYTPVDICDADSVRLLIETVQPKVIYHLAAQSSVRMSFDQRELTHAVNVGGTRNLLDGVARYAPECIVVIVSSAEVYAPCDGLLTENSPLDRTSSPYAASRVDQEALLREYLSLDIRLARSFNHTGPKQLPTFVIASFAEQIALIKMGTQAPRIEVGNLDAVRDFSDVRDVVEAYVLLALQGQPHEAYNICSGEERSIGDLLRLMIEQSGRQIEIHQDQARMRPSDKPRLVGDPSKFVGATGWHRVFSISETLRDMVSYFESRVTSVEMPIASST